MIAGPTVFGSGGQGDPEHGRKDSTVSAPSVERLHESSEDRRPPLTERQRLVRDFIVQFTQERGYPPTLRQIGDGLGMKSTNGVNDHLRSLENKGYIARDAGISRGLRVLVTE